jgi:hypothetical protein
MVLLYWSFKFEDNAPLLMKKRFWVKEVDGKMEGLTITRFGLLIIKLSNKKRHLK